MTDTDTNITVEDILAKCPSPVISRRMAAEHVSGGFYAERSLANLDSLGAGPAERVKIGRRSGYTSRSFAEWLVAKIKIQKQSNK